MTEEERILAEVQRRRERAKELGLFDLLTFFRDHLEFLNEGPDPERLPASVTDVKVLDTRSGDKRGPVAWNGLEAIRGGGFYRRRLGARNKDIYPKSPCPR